jgi:hypothetical protein
MNELLQSFDEYLRRIGYTGIPNAKRLREERKSKLNRLLQQEKYNLQRLPGALEEALALAKDHEERQILEEIREFLGTVLPPTERPSSRPLSMPSQKLTVKSRIIGRVAPTLQTPASHSEFPFWVQPNAQLTIGEIVVAESPDGNVKVVGVVRELNSSTTLRSPVEHFFACDLGTPEAELPTEIPVVLTGKAGILWRSDRRFAPPEKDWRLRRATPEEIRRALSGEVASDYAVPAGFIHAFDEQGQTVWVPVDMDLRWLAGYESGHINIAGISGVAAKTSYGLFLTMGLLAAASRESAVRKEGGLAIVAFNVKEVDLLYLENCKEWAKAPEVFTEELDMWKIFQRDYLEGKDPAELLLSPRYQAPGQKGALGSLRRDETLAFRYGWQDIKRADASVAFYALFNPDDLDDKMVTAIEAALAEEKARSWENLLSLIQALLKKQNPRKSEQWVQWGDSSHHPATLHKLYNRLRAIEEAMGPMLEHKNPNGEPLAVERLSTGDFMVIDITRLGDRARRFLFFRLINDLQRKLEERKARLSSDFPGRVVVFVDELNVFAPAGGGRHPTRERLVHIAARGRSVGLTLLGMQQLASRVDDEVLANTSTLAVGRVHPTELSNSAYAWVRAWRDQVMALPTGTMLVSHPLWREPIMVRFPRPLHLLAEKARQAWEILKWM